MSPAAVARARRPRTARARATGLASATAAPATRASRAGDLSPVITPEGTVLTQHVVAGNEPCHRVGADGPAHRPGGAGATHRARERRVRGRSGAAELEQRLPDLELKVRAFHGELERWRGPRASRAARRGPDTSRERRRGVLVAPQAR